MTREAIADGDVNPTSQGPVDEKHQVDGNDSVSTVESNEKRRFARLRDNEHAKTAWRIMSWTPKRCRWDPKEPPHFSMGLNLLFGFGEHFYIELQSLFSLIFSVCQSGVTHIRPMMSMSESENDKIWASAGIFSRPKEKLSRSLS